MKPFERQTHRNTFLGAIIVFAAMVVLVLSSTSARRAGVAVLVAASVFGLQNGTTAAATDDSNAIRPFASTFQRLNSWNCAGVCSQRGGRARKQCRIAWS
jgi:hypothetical protein